MSCGWWFQSCSLSLEGTAVGALAAGAHLHQGSRKQSIQARARSANSQKPTPVTCLCHLGPNSKGSPAPETAPATVDHKSLRGQFRLKPVILNTLPYTLMAPLYVFREIHIQQCVHFPIALAKILDKIKEEGFLFLFLSGMPLGRALLWQKWHDSSDPLPPGWPAWQPRVHLMGLWGTLHFQTITLYEIDK